MNKLNLVSYNVHGLYHPIKRKKILSQLKKLQCEIALVQETHLSENEHKKLKREWVNQVFHASYGKKRGVAILISKSLPFTVEKVIKDDMGRYIMVVCIVGDMTISILNIYASNEENETFFFNIANMVTINERGMIIMGGDFSTIQNSKLDRLPAERGPNTKKSRVLNNVIKEQGLIDPWRNNNPKGKHFTVYSNPHGSYSIFFVFQNNRYTRLRIAA